MPLFRSIGPLLLLGSLPIIGCTSELPSLDAGALEAGSVDAALEAGGDGGDAAACPAGGAAPINGSTSLDFTCACAEPRAVSDCNDYPSGTFWQCDRDVWRLYFDGPCGLGADAGYDAGPPDAG